MTLALAPQRSGKGVLVREDLLSAASLLDLFAAGVDQSADVDAATTKAASIMEVAHWLREQAEQQRMVRCKSP